MKEDVTKVIDTLTQNDFDGAFQKLLEQYKKCIAAGGDYFEGEKSAPCDFWLFPKLRGCRHETIEDIAAGGEYFEGD